MIVSGITAGRPHLRARHSGGVLHGESYKACCLITSWYRHCTRERRGAKGAGREDTAIGKTRRGGGVRRVNSTSLFNCVRPRYSASEVAGESERSPSALNCIIRYVRAICILARDAHSPAAALIPRAALISGTNPRDSGAFVAQRAINDAFAFN